jgi:hypothetical protein
MKSKTVCTTYDTDEADAEEEVKRVDDAMAPERGREIAVPHRSD